MSIYVNVDTVDSTPKYLAEMDSALQKAIADVGNDLQAVAKAAAPEKTSHLVNNITVKFSSTQGAYQADLESKAVDGKHDYVEWMHNGKYQLGSKSRTKAGGQSKIAGYRKDVGRNYLVGSGEKGSKGYTEYIMTKADAVNDRYNSN